MLVARSDRSEAEGTAGKEDHHQSDLEEVEPGRLSRHDLKQLTSGCIRSFWFFR
jgi:hypothetical protein